MHSTFIFRNSALYTCPLNNNKKKKKKSEDDISGRRSIPLYVMCNDDYNKNNINNNKNDDDFYTYITNVLGFFCGSCACILCAISMFFVLSF